MDRLYLLVNVNDSHKVSCVVYLDKRFISIYNILNIMDIVKKCSYIGIMIPLVMHFLGYHGYGIGSESDPYKP